MEYLTTASLAQFFFSETITSAVYLEINDQFIALSPVYQRYYFFQQDGEKVHTAHTIMAVLKKFFDDRLISVVQWSSRSLDLNKYDFFLRGYLKDRSLFARTAHSELETQYYWGNLSNVLRPAFLLTEVSSNIYCISFHFWCVWFFTNFFHGNEIVVAF